MDAALGSEDIAQRSPRQTGGNHDRTHAAVTHRPRPVRSGPNLLHDSSEAEMTDTERIANKVYDRHSLMYQLEHEREYPHAKALSPRPNVSHVTNEDMRDFRRGLKWGSLFCAILYGFCWLAWEYAPKILAFIWTWAVRP